MNNNDKNIISFGKHKSKTWNDVYLNEPKYCRWVENTMPKFLFDGSWYLFFINSLYDIFNKINHT